MAPLFSMLGLAADADDAAVRAAFRRRVAELHPDRNPGFREQATRACAGLTSEFAAYSADPDAYRRAHRATSTIPEPDAPPPTGVPELDDAIDLASSLVELLAPADRLEAARRAVVSGAKIARRYVGANRR